MKKYVALIVIVVAGMFIMAANTAQAYTYATSGAWEAGSNVTIGSDRGDLSNALGAPDGPAEGTFLSLGLGGAAVFDFGVEFDAAAIIFETTWGDPSRWKEYADVYVANLSFDFTAEAGSGGYAELFPLDSSFTLAGHINNYQPETLSLDLSGLDGPFRYVLVVDTTGSFNDGAGGDGFDIDAVGVVPVPEPSTVFLLGVGVLGLVGLSRKLKK